MTKEINEFVDETKNKIARNQLDLEISRVSIQGLLTNKYSEYVNQEQYILQEKDHFQRLRNSLFDFDITTIRELDNLISSTLNKYSLLSSLLLDNKGRTRDINFIIYILMFSDFNLFFEKKVLSSDVVGPRTYEILIKYFSKEEVDVALDSAHMVLLKEVEE